MEASPGGRLAIVRLRGTIAAALLVLVLLMLDVLSGAASVTLPRHLLQTPVNWVAPSTSWPPQQQSPVLRRECTRLDGRTPPWCPEATSAASAP